MQFYQNPNRPDHAENNTEFVRVVNAFPGLSLFFPNAGKAPWHVQAIIDCGHEQILINFWPHSLKAQRDGCKAVEGAGAIKALIATAFEDANQPPFDLVEGW